MWSKFLKNANDIFTHGFDLFKQFAEFHSTRLWQTLIIVDTGGENCIVVFLKGQEIDFRKPFNLNIKKNMQSGKQSF